MKLHIRAGQPGRVVQAVAVSLFLALGISACGTEGSGEDLYSMACASCHGADRVGLEDVGPDLGATSTALEESDNWITGRIRDGFKGMPRFGQVLTENQTAIIVTYLREAEAAATTPSPTTTTAPPTDASVSTTGAAATTTTAAPGVDPAVLALGQTIFDVGAGGEACASCHEFDAQGTDDGPDITGESKSSVKNALSGDVREMEDIALTADEIEAVHQYLLLLTEQR
jgi:mono/diheme cytochrome c family protein